VPAIVSQHPPITPERIELPGPDSPAPDHNPEIHHDPTVPPKIIEEPEPIPRQPDHGDNDDEPPAGPPTHGSEGSP